MIILVILVIAVVCVLLNWIRLVAWVTQKRIQFRHWLTGLKLSVLEFLDDMGLL